MEIALIMTPGKEAVIFKDDNFWRIRKFMDDLSYEFNKDFCRLMLFDNEEEAKKYAKEKKFRLPARFRKYAKMIEVAKQNE